MNYAASTKTALAGLVVASSLAIAGCGGTVTTNATAPSATPATPKATIAGSLDVSLLRYTDADFDVKESPEELAISVPVVAVGVVAGWDQGPGLEIAPGGPLLHHVLLKMTVTDVLKGAKGNLAAAGGDLYIRIYQGPVVRDESKKPSEWSPGESVEDFQKAVPPGTRIMFFGQEDIIEEGRIKYSGIALPSAARRMIAPPQGLVLEDPALARLSPDAGSSLLGGMHGIDLGTASPWAKPKNMDELVALLKSKDLQGS